MKTKKRRTKDLCDSSSSSELLHAAAFNLRQGRISDSIKLHKIANSPDAFSLQGPPVYSPEKALAILLDCNLTKQAYQHLRNEAREIGSNIYPSYNRIREAKEKCMPDKDSLDISDFFASVNLQSLLDHTAKRICLTQREILQSKPMIKRLPLRYKAGFDGSTGQAVYKQVASDGSARDLQTEESLFLTRAVEGGGRIPPPPKVFLR